MTPAMESKREEKTTEDMDKSENQQYKAKFVFSRKIILGLGLGSMDLGLLELWKRYF